MSSEPAGRTAGPSGATRSAELAVQGMTCAACQAHVQRALMAVPGVEQAAVDLLGGRAWVRWATQGTVSSPESLVSALERAGYGAQLNHGDVDLAEETRRRDEELRTESTRAAWRAGWILAVGGFVMLFSMPLMEHRSHEGWWLERWMVALDQGLRASMPAIYDLPPRAIALSLVVVTLLGMALGAGSIYRTGIRSLRHGAPTMNSLVALGTGAAFVWSVAVSMSPGWFRDRELGADVYFEAVWMVLGFVLLGQALEARAKRQASSALGALLAMQPERARLVTDQGEREVDVGSLLPGDRVLVKPGERVPVDGHVLEGRAAVDESNLTGESMPVAKGPGAAVLGGTLNQSGAMLVRVDAVGAESTLARYARALREVERQAAPMQRLADRVSAVFVPAVLLLALLTLIAWGTFAEQAPISRGLAAAVAVLIIACPCAMGLAVPTAVVVAAGRAARAGILMKGGEALERAAGLDWVVFDKTGTLTEGRPDLERIDAPSEQSRYLADVAAVEQFSEHPLGDALVRAAKARGLQLLPASEFASAPGEGVFGRVDGRGVWVGNRGYVQRVAGSQWPPELASEPNEASSGATVIYAFVEGSGVGRFLIRDQPRADAKEVVEELRRSGYQTMLLSGDGDATTQAVARSLGIQRALGGVRPEGKVEVLADLKRRGLRVAMVGDGVNDALALATADVGIALGTGTQVAVQAAHWSLLGSDLRGVVRALALARAAVRTMRQNLVWAFGFNALAIPVAAGALYPSFGLLLSPAIAGGAMALSSVLVVTNSLRLAGYRIQLGHRP